MTHGRQSTAHRQRVRCLSAVELERMRHNVGGAEYPERMQCAAPGCLEPFTHRASWAYVTGRKGRITTAEREYCRRHAERFAKKNAIAMEPTP